MALVLKCIQNKCAMAAGIQTNKNTIRVVGGQFPNSWPTYSPPPQMSKSPPPDLQKGTPRTLQKGPSCKGILQAGCSRGLPLNHHVLLWMVWRLAPSQGAWKMKKHTYGWWQYCAASVQFNFNFYICIYTTHIYEQKYVYNLNLR